VADRTGTGATCTIGQVILNAGSVGNGIPADGQLLQISQYQELYNLYGTTYGGDGTTTFGLPNLTAAAPNGMTDSICWEGDFPGSS
jgi:microcystin-dependent protein